MGVCVKTLLIMVALWNRADHYIFHPVVSSIFFSSLNLSCRRVMSAILAHMVWP